MKIIFIMKFQNIQHPHTPPPSPRNLVPIKVTLILPPPDPGKHPC